jgi:SAM-dependent methyltransferase
MNPTKIDYVSVVYDETSRPLTDYPRLLSKNLFDRYGLMAGQCILEVGCGRGEFLRGFIDCGMQGYGVDQSRAAEKYCPEADLKVADLENERLPYADATFDVVYSKSVIEHFYYPERIIAEIHRVMKPGGLIITLCPDWEFNYRIYFEDFTHRTPFMQSSLRDIHLMYGFEEVKVERFRQLPVLWNTGPWLLPLAEITRLLAPIFLKSRSKWVRFSKEIMLLSSAQKPLSSTGSSRVKL